MKPVLKRNSQKLELLQGGFNGYQLLSDGKGEIFYQQAVQYKQILNTFQNKDQFIVVGTRPMDGSVTSEALDQVLSEKWGEHYISLANVTQQLSATYEAQQAMAEAVFQKLQELGYISQGNGSDHPYRS